MSVYTFPFSEQENWTLSDANISGGTLNITAQFGYGKRSPDANWYSGSGDDFEIEFDFQINSSFNTAELNLKLDGDAIIILFYARASYNHIKIYYNDIERGSLTTTISLGTWYTGKVRRVGTTFYFSVNGGDEISWDYGTERALEYLRLVQSIGLDGGTKFDNFIYRWIEPVTHEIAGVINALSQIIGESTVISGGYSDFFQNKLLNHIFGSITYSPPTTYYIALSTANPKGDGSGLSEPSGNGYERKSVDNNKTNWSTSSDGVISNAIEIAFIEATGNWGTITHLAIFDAESGGNMLVYEKLITPKTVEADQTVKCAIGDLEIRCS